MRDFFSALWIPANAYGELRVIKRLTGQDKPAIAQEFIPLNTKHAHQEAAALAAEYDRQGWDVYFGVLRRTARSGTAADTVDHTPVLWADVDPYKVGESDGYYLPHATEKLLELVGLFPIPPSIIVDSGNGIHAYWLLRDAAPVADASLAMKGIAKAVGGDHTHDPARVLRVPGTYNHKDALDPKPVRLLRLDTTRRYRFSDFSEYLDAAIGSKRGTPHGWTQTYERREDIPVWLDELIRNGVPRGSRSEQSFKVAVWLMRYGWSDADIWAVFRASPNGIGEKYAERGDRWLDITLKAAREAA